MKIVHRTHARMKNLNEKIKLRLITKLSASLPREKKIISHHQHLNPTIMEVVPNKQNTKVVGSNWLVSFKDNQYSEHGEDGIISKIFDIMPPENKWVCEFGAHDPENISNTWRLINNEGWNAVLIEADLVYAEKLKKYYEQKPDVHCVNTKVSYEGNERLDRILAATPIPHNMDFMIIDIDGNDYHVWEAIETYRAKVVMIEFNASIPTDVSFVQQRDMTVNQGTSLKAMTELAAKKGYKLIAVTSWNAFFIQHEYYHLFFRQEPLLEDMYVYPAKHPIWMRPFQLYDGTIAVAPWDEMLWHKVNLSETDYQVLPASMRVFSRELMIQNKLAEKYDSALRKIYQMPGNVLSTLAKNYFSNYGEDGILEALLPCVASNKFFVEVGAGDGLTGSLSRNLLVNYHWKGLQFENDIQLLPRLKVNTAGHRANIISSPYTLSGVHSLDQVLDASGNVPADPDVMILKVYGMEYFLWESLAQYSPKVMVVQFNPTIPNDVKFIQTKDFSVHHGCSLKALCDLAAYKDYELVAVTLETAIFVKRKYTYRLLEMYGLQHASLDEMFCPVAMRWFQLYDGTIVSRGLNSLLWMGIEMDEDKLQVVPKALRKFHQFADPESKRFFYRV
jgi:hypothetical protein